MMSHEIDHSNGHYIIKAHGKPVAIARKWGSGFILRGHEGPNVAPITMRDLKAQIEASLPQEAKTKPRTNPEPTRQDWINLSAVSHTGTYIYLREAKKTWPELKGAALYRYLIRKSVEARAQWEGIDGDYARAWLQDNPAYGAYDVDEELRRLAVLYPYGDQE